MDSPSLQGLLESIRVLPVLTCDTVKQAVDASHALQHGGLKAVEVTLRTPVALEAIAAVKSALPGFVVAAGTVKSVADMKAVRQAGADFAVSPGFTVRLAEAAREEGLPYLPGVATPSEILLAAEQGLACFKLFPASAVGGLALLKALASPLEGIVFCPTGGINESNYRDYLALPNVVCVGGSWMVAPDLLRQDRWAEIEERARACALP